MSKREIIQNLEKEVKDFQPILERLFEKMPEIKIVAKKQGPSEMGADFILTKLDTTLDEELYIGVIVKVGKIKQNHEEINRQIDECRIPRFNEGVKTVNLNEIWIVNNDQITENAKVKIKNKYDSQNIRFISGEKVVSLIDKFYPEYWDSLSPHLDKYFYEMNSNFKENSLKSDTLGIISKNGYITQNLIKKEKYNKNTSNIIRRKNVNVNFSSIEDSLEKFISVEAHMGGGKTQLFINSCQKLINPVTFKQKKVIPIFIKGKYLFDTFMSNNGLIKWYNNTIDNFKDDLTYSYYIYIDGLDEIDVSSEEIAIFLKGLYINFNNRPLAKVS